MAYIINVVGLRASGQTTIVRELARRNNARRAKRVTDRPPRRGELDDYIHLERLEMAQCVEKGEIIEGTLRDKAEQGLAYVTGVLVPEKWDFGPAELVISMFGTVSLLVKKILKEKYDIEMYNVYLFVPPWERRKRLAQKEAVTGISFEADRTLLAKQPSDKEWELAMVELLEARRSYDHVVINDRSVRECVENIEKFFHLRPKRK